MQPIDIAETVAALSAPRLASYRAFFSPANDHELYGVYAWNEALSSCLTVLLNNLEITMRNAFHRELSQRYGSARGTSSSDWWANLVLLPKSSDKIKAITHDRHRNRWWLKQPCPTPDDVVSKLSLGFWKHLLDVVRDNQGAPVDWANILTALLPNHGLSNPPFWKRQVRRDQLFGRIELVGDLRNRIAHLEPVWKAGPLLEEGRARPNYVRQAVTLAPQTPTEAIDRLKLVHNRALELLFWMSRYRADDYMRSSAYARFRHLATMGALNSWKGGGATRTVTIQEIRGLIRSAAPVDCLVEITDGTKVLARVYPWEA